MKKLTTIFLFCMFASCSSNRYLVRFDDQKSFRLPAEILSVVDGDTVHVRIWENDGGIPAGFHSVRMIYIDAMESSDNPKLERNLLQFFSKGIYVKKEAVLGLGKMAAERLNQALRTGDRVELEMSRIEPMDKYGRLLAQVFRNGTNVNYLMVSEGMADVYFLNDEPGPRTQFYKKRYFEARDRAKREYLGIWKTLN